VTRVHKLNVTFYIQEADLELDNVPTTPPHLVIVADECLRGKWRSYILADGINISCGEDAACALVLNLIACYYAWELLYPKQFQVLAFLQTYLVGDKKNAVQHGAPLVKFSKVYQECAE